MSLDLTGLRPTYNGTALAAGIAAAPAVTHVLHIAGDQYGIALALLTATGWLDHRRHLWLTRALLYTAAAGSALTWPAVADLTAYLTGVRP